jgi:tRNA G18 (ribose-2'-O)-methylase SpoU
MKERIRTKPNFADSSPAHIAAIASGREHFESWLYNVEDRFKPCTKEEIKATLKETAFPYAVLCENLIGDFNIATVIRNANAFNAKEFFYIGDKKFDKRGACGVFNYTDINWISSIEELLKLKEHYSFVGIDNVPGSVPLTSFKFPKNPLFIFGSESVGITPAMQELCDSVVHITMHGSVRSLNVGVASGIVLNEFVSNYMDGKCNKIF